MKEANFLVDDQSSFGTFAPDAETLRAIKLMRRLPPHWLGKRLMFFMRRRAMKKMAHCVDVDLFGADMRLYTTGNVSEKRALFAPQFFDFEERKALKALADDNAVFIDIGANVGLYSFSTAAAFKHYENARIISVEPHPVMSRRLAFNAAANPDLPIEPVMMGLSDKNGTMTLMTGDNNFGESRLLERDESTNGETFNVPVRTLLSLLDEKQIKRVDGLKIDIEGYEEAVLAPFLKEAPDSLLPELIIIEDNFDKWNADLIGLSQKRGFAKMKHTRMNVILHREEI
jgi:FkbM family methyltransferase